jgi:hypothetical protein
MAQVLATEDQGDGTTVVTVATSRYGQARVTVPTAMLDDPAVEHLYDHVEDWEKTTATVRRVSRRDEKRRGA